MLPVAAVVDEVGMITRILLFVLVFDATTAGAAELTPTDFAYGQTVIAPEPATAYRVALPLELYRSSVRSDLGDVRVFNERGAVVPYSLQRPNLETLQSLPAVKLPLFPLTGEKSASPDAIRVTIESGHGAVNVETQGAAQDRQAIAGYILDARATDRPIAALTLDWPVDAAEFAGRLRIETSDDLSAWSVVSSGAALANLGAGANRLIERRVEFAPAHAKYWRLTWADRSAPFALTGAEGEPAQDRVELVRATLMLSAQVDAKAPGEFAFDTAAQVPVDRVAIELPETNTIVQAEILSRAQPAHAWREVARRGFYRLTSANTEIASAWVPIATNTDRYWLVRIDRTGAGIGTGAPKLTLGWVPHELIFLARGSGPFQLAYGSISASSGGVAVDSILPGLTAGGDATYRVKVVAATLGPQVTLGGEARRLPVPPPIPWKLIALWSSLGLGVVVLAFMALRLSRETNGS
jgi:hypothetical protein